MSSKTNAPSKISRRTIKSSSRAPHAATLSQRFPGTKKAMMQNTMRAAALAAFALLVPTFASAATSPTPRALPTPHLPDTPLHTEFHVEVNKMGQVVRTTYRKGCPSLTFNAQTYGNVLQMWIRRPDGTAVVGLYRVWYDYDPKKHNVARHVSLLKAGGNWGDAEGAANHMIGIAKRDYERYAAQQAAAERKQQQGAKNLPDINTILKEDAAKPTASPRP